MDHRLVQRSHCGQVRFSFRLQARHAVLTDCYLPALSSQILTTPSSMATSRQATVCWSRKISILICLNTDPKLCGPRIPHFCRHQCDFSRWQWYIYYFDFGRMILMSCNTGYVVNFVNPSNLSDIFASSQEFQVKPLGSE